MLISPAVKGRAKGIRLFAPASAGLAKRTAKRPQPTDASSVRFPFRPPSKVGRREFTARVPTRSAVLRRLVQAAWTIAYSQLHRSRSLHGDALSGSIPISPAPQKKEPFGSIFCGAGEGNRTLNLALGRPHLHQHFQRLQRFVLQSVPHCPKFQ